MTKVTINKNRLNHIIAESIKKCVLNLNEGTPHQDMDTYNRLSQKIEDSDDPFYQERAKRVRHNLARHVQSKYDLDDNIYNRVYPDKDSWYLVGASKPKYQHANNQQLKGLSAMRKNNVPYHFDKLNDTSRAKDFSSDGTFNSHLYENKIKQIVAESIKEILREGGHMTGTYDDGTRWTNSEDTWRGVKGTTFIWHGEWNDPEVWYDGKELNGSQLEDYAWDVYKTECKENGREPNEDEFDNLPTEWFEELIEDFMLAMFADQN